MASREWIKFNDDSRAASNRKKYVEANGGEFIRCKTGWEWMPSKGVKKVEAPKIAPVSKSKVKVKKNDP